MNSWFLAPFGNLNSFKRRANIQTNYCFHNSPGIILYSSFKKAVKNLKINILN